MTGRELRARLFARADEEYLAEFRRGILFGSPAPVSHHVALASALRFEAERLEVLRARGLFPLQDSGVVPLGGGGLGLD